MKYDIYGMGNALVDMEFEVPTPFCKPWAWKRASLTLVDEERQFELLEYLRGEHSVRSGGGSAANTVVANALFGGSSFYTCLVSNDEMGDFYTQELARAGVDTNLAERRAGERDGQVSLVMITPDAERTMNTFLGISESLSAAEVRPDACATRSTSTPRATWSPRPLRGRPWLRPCGWRARPGSRRP